MDRLLLQLHLLLLLPLPLIPPSLLEVLEIVPPPLLNRNPLFDSSHNWMILLEGTLDLLPQEEMMSSLYIR